MEYNTGRILGFVLGFMEQETLPLLHWPKLQWRANFWLSLIPFVLGFVVFFFPDLEQEIFEGQRNYIGIALLSLALVIPVVIWLFQVVLVVFKRVKHYPKSYGYGNQQKHHLHEAHKTIFSLLNYASDGKSFEITNARYDQGTLYIVLKKQRVRLVKGNQVVAVHLTDQRPMGLFEVTEVRSNSFYAKAVGLIDEYWLDEVRRRGEISALPFMVALHIPQRDEQ